jgi:hypothetical protein
MPWGEHKTFEWFYQFKHGETSVDSEHSGCPLTGHTDENVENVHKIINEDQPRKVRPLVWNMQAHSN